MISLIVGLALYALLWFFGNFAFYGEGGTRMRNGALVRLREGEVVRVFTPAHARWLEARAMSVFSAAWAAIALPIAIAYQRRKSRRDPQR